MALIEYPIVYILGGFIGWVIEKYYFNKENPLCGDTVNRKFLNICLPFLHVWAIGVLFLTILSNNYKNINILLLTIIAGIILTSFECLAGQLSFLINKYKTWDSSAERFFACNGFIGIIDTMNWFLFSFLFLIFYPLAKAGIPKIFNLIKK